MITFNPTELGGGGFAHPKFSIFHNVIDPKTGKVVESGIANRRLELVANGSLTREEGRAIDDAVKTIQRRALPIMDLLARYNLIRPLGGLGILLDEYNKRSGFTAAEVNMDGRTRSQGDKADYKAAAVPIPIISKHFALPMRDLIASRARGVPLDTAGIEEATRVVSEKVQDIIVNGSTLVYAGNSIKGFTTATNRNTGSLTAVWTNTGARDILKDVRAMKQALFADGAPGPYALLIPDTYNTELEDDYKAAAMKTYIQRIKEIGGIVEVLPVQALAAGNVVLVDLNKSTFDYSQALPIQVVPWSSGDGTELHFKVMTAGAPRVKDDYDSNSGVAHYT